MQERRKHNRHAVQARVKLYHPEFGAVDGVSSNISDGGVYVEVAEMPAVRPGEAVKMVLLDSRNPDFIFNCEVARVEEGALALAILSYESGGQTWAIRDLRRQWHTGT